MIIKLIPHVTYRDNANAELKREGETLYISGEALDLSGEWAVLEWGENEDKGLIRSATKEDGTVTLHVTAYQPDEYKAARTMGVLDAMEQPITLKDGQSVTFPDYLKEVADNAYKGN